MRYSRSHLFTTVHDLVIALRLTFPGAAHTSPGMARPRKGEELGATTGVACRITPQLRADLDKLAEKHGRTITQEIRVALADYVEAHRGRADVMLEARKPR